MGLASPGVAQNTIAVFPCRVKPAANQDCNALPKGEAPTPPGSTPSPVIGVNDYYDVYIESVCIDQPDSWWKNKLVNLSATVSVGKNLIKVPAYQDRTGSQCRIGLANFPLVTSVPANGQSLGLAASILRSDKNDGLQKLLSFMTGEQKSTELSTYAAAAVPYVTAISNLASQIYDAFGAHTTTWLNMKSMALTPQSDVAPGRFDLKDEYIVQYAGPDSPQDREIYVDGNDDLRWAKDDTLVRNRSSWILYRIQKQTHRQDYPTRPWYTQWQDLVLQAAARSIDVATVKNRFQQINVLVMNDADYTYGDKRYYVQLFNQSESDIIKSLTDPNVNKVAVSQAVKDSTVTPKAVGLDPTTHKIVTATNTKEGEPVVTLPTLGRSIDKVIAPEAFVRFVHDALELKGKT